TWETDAGKGRAPQYCRVTLSFSPIHDEPLGLNPDGSLRAAAYPVGGVIENIMGPRFSGEGGDAIGGMLNSIALQQAGLEAISPAGAEEGSDEPADAEGQAS
ncbi:MAG TPA: hypothetical protein DEQ32_11610, partial [Gammaproteobacteria bacterium]|nr:hypothetical protein [Gammaproteobacteria bacterium]